MAKLTDYIEKKRTDILADWRANKISYGEAMNRLCALGFSIEQVTEWLAQ